MPTRPDQPSHTLETSRNDIRDRILHWREGSPDDPRPRIYCPTCGQVTRQDPQEARTAQAQGRHPQIPLHQAPHHPTWTQDHYRGWTTIPACPASNTRTPADPAP